MANGGAGLSLAEKNENGARLGMSSFDKVEIRAIGLGKMLPMISL